MRLKGEKGKKAKRDTSSDSDSVEDDENDFEEPVVDLLGMIEGRREHMSGDLQSDNLVLKMLEILLELQKDPTSGPFWEPVDEEYYTDYRDKVDEPMDLGSIARRVSVGFYAHPDEFAEDVRKVWSNCQAYNLEGSEIYANSQNLGSIFESMLSRINTSKLPTDTVDKQPSNVNENHVTDYDDEVSCGLESKVIESDAVITTESTAPQVTADKDTHDIGQKEVEMTNVTEPSLSEGNN